MKILFVCSGTRDRIAPFIKDQQSLLIEKGLKVDLFTIENVGIKGYIKSIFKLRRYLKQNKYDLIHAHYGLSGLVATFQKESPVIVTYHGSDIHQSRVFKYSKIAIKRAHYNIFVSQKLLEIANTPSNSSVIPCGVDLKIFHRMENRSKLREKLGFLQGKKYVLFSSSFDRSIKNPDLAIQAIKSLANVELIELKGYSRKEVAELMNAVDLCLLISENEGSPQFIKESAACDQWIVSTMVGDVDEILQNYPKVTYTRATVNDVKSTVSKTLEMVDIDAKNSFDISKYDNEKIASKLISVYQNALR